MNGNPASKFGGEVIGQFFLAEGGVILEVVDEAEGELLVLPFLKAALAPFAEVLGADGVAVEMFIQDRLDFGERTEPVHELPGVVAVLKALIKLFADVVREPSDFAFASGHKQVMGSVSV